MKRLPSWIDAVFLFIMGYIDEQIERAAEELNRLKAEKKKRQLKNAPNVIGKYFLNKDSTKAIKPLVFDIHENMPIVFCQTIRMTGNYLIIEHNDVFACESLTNEISKEEYYSWYDKAIEFISNLKNE